MGLTRPDADAGRLGLEQAITENWEAKKCPVACFSADVHIPIVIRRSVWNAIYEHGGSRTDVEVCGVLVGNGYRDEQGAFVHVEAIVQGNHAESRLAQVTFTGDTWNHIHQVMDRDFSDKRIIGWYHTHPGFGIFLSPMDLFIHENFFSAPEQLAIVFDPINRTEGLFTWRDGQAVPGKFVIEEDVDPLVAVSAATPAPEVSFVIAAESVAQAPVAPIKTSTWLRWIVLVALLVLLAYVGLTWPWIAAKVRNEGRRDRRPSTTPLPKISGDSHDSTTTAVDDIPDEHHPTASTNPAVEQPAEPVPQVIPDDEAGSQEQAGNPDSGAVMGIGGQDDRQPAANAAVKRAAEQPANEPAKCESPAPGSSSSERPRSDDPS